MKGTFRTGVMIVLVFLAASAADAKSAIKPGAKAAAKKPIVMQQRVVIRFFETKHHEAQRFEKVTLMQTADGRNAALEFSRAKRSDRRVRIPSGLSSTIENDTLQAIWDLQYKTPLVKTEKCEAFAEVKVISTGDRFTACANQMSHATRVGELVRKIGELAPKS